MKNLKRIWIVLSVFLLFATAVAAQETVIDSLQDIAGDIPQLYENNFIWIDGILYLFLFIFIAQYSLGKMNMGKPLPTVIGIALALSAVVAANRLDFKLGDLGPFALVFFMLVIGYTIFVVVKELGIGEEKAWAFAYLIAYGFLTAAAPELFELVNEQVPIVSFILALVLVIAIIVAVITIVQLVSKGFGGNKEQQQSPTTPNQPTPQRPSRPSHAFPPVRPQPTPIHPVPPKPQYDPNPPVDPILPQPRVIPPVPPPEPTKIKDPEAIDLSPYFLPIANQQKAGSCTAFAATGIFEYIINKSTNTLSWNHELSKLFLWYNSRVDRTHNTGAYNETVAKSMVKQGVCFEHLWSYEPLEGGVPTKFRQAPPEKAYADAITKRIGNVKALNPRNPDSWVTELENGNPIFIGISVDEQFKLDGLQKKSIYAKKGGRHLGGHAIVIVGFTTSFPNPDKPSEGMPAFKIRNSWGSNWGENGYIWVPRDLLPTLLSDYPIVLTDWQKKSDDIVKGAVKAEEHFKKEMFESVDNLLKEEEILLKHAQNEFQDQLEGLRAKQHADMEKLHAYYKEQYRNLDHLTEENKKPFIEEFAKFGTLLELFSLKKHIEGKDAKHQLELVVECRKHVKELTPK